MIGKPYIPDPAVFLALPDPVRDAKGQKLVPLIHCRHMMHQVIIHTNILHHGNQMVPAGGMRIHLAGIRNPVGRR